MTRVLFVTKRRYTNKDLVRDRFGRLFHIPLQMVQNGRQVAVVTVNYRGIRTERAAIAGLDFISIPFLPPPLFFIRAFKAMQRFAPDIIIASGDSYLGYFGLQMAKRKRIPFIFDIYDDYRVFGSNRLPLMKALFLKTLKTSDWNFCAGLTLMNRLKRYSPSITHLPNGFDAGLFKPMPREKARAGLNIGTRDTVIGYFGSMAPNYGIETLIAAADRLGKITPGLRLLLAGARHPSVSLSHPLVDYRGELPQKEMPFLINASDVVVIPYDRSPQIDVSDPCKLSEYLACRVPIVSTTVSHLASSLSAIPRALCAPGDPQDMQNAINWQLRNRRTLPVPHTLTWEHIANKAMQKIDKLAAGGRV